MGQRFFLCRYYLADPFCLSSQLCKLIKIGEKVMKNKIGAVLKIAELPAINARKGSPK